jgi:hypothetical protein
MGNQTTALAQRSITHLVVNTLLFLQNVCHTTKRDILAENAQRFMRLRMVLGKSSDLPRLVLFSILLV